MGRVKNIILFKFILSKNYNIKWFFLIFGKKYYNINSIGYFLVWGVFKFLVLEVILFFIGNNGFIVNCLYKLNKNDFWSFFFLIVLLII